jgi:hypothetical protein
MNMNTHNTRHYNNQYNTMQYLLIYVHYVQFTAAAEDEDDDDDEWPFVLSSPRQFVGLPQ